MNKRSVLTTALVVAAGAFFAPVYAQEAAATTNSTVAQWSIITAGFALAFAAGLVLGVGGPLLYTVWHRERSLASLGLTTARWPVTVGLGVLFAGVQFALTLWGYDLPAAEAWVPLLVMSLVVGAFEAVFFRGFIQGGRRPRHAVFRAGARWRAPAPTAASDAHGAPHAHPPPAVVRGLTMIGTATR